MASEVFHQQICAVLQGKVPQSVSLLDMQYLHGYPRHSVLRKVGLCPAECQQWALQEAESISRLLHEKRIWSCRWEFDFCKERHLPPIGRLVHASHPFWTINAVVQLERSSSKCPPRHRFELLPLCHTLPRCPLPRARFPKVSLSLATGKSWVWRPNSTGSHSDLQPALELEIHFQYPQLLRLALCLIAGL